MPLASEFARSYNSFSGADIKAVFANKTVGTLQAISYSITREKAPIYTMGSADPRAFSRGKRGIGGSLIFIVFDRDELLSALQELKFQSDTDDLRPGTATAGPDDSDFGQPPLTSTSGRTAAAQITRQTGTPVGSSTIQQQESDLTSVASDQEISSAWYADQLPPFDVTISAANEYGALCSQRIYGVEILNEGFGISVDDMVIEKQYTYVCRAVSALKPIPNERFFEQAGLRSS